MTYWRSETLHPQDVDVLMYYAPLMRGAPYLAAIEGSASGAALRYEQQAGIAALAEYVERRHFLHRVPTASLRQVRAFAPYLPALQACYQQLVPEMPGEAIASSMVGTVPAMHYRNLAPVQVPRNLVCLSDRQGSADLRLHPRRDSCGMAAHTTAADAIAASTLEFIERQGWVAAWLGAGTVIRIALPQPCSSSDPMLPVDSHCRLECYWLDTGLPTYTVFAAYFNDRSLGSQSAACFSCGLAASGDPGLSLRRARAEASHYRHFAAEKLAAGGSHCRMEANSLRFQVPQARDLLPFLSRVGATLEARDFCELPVQDLSHTRSMLAGDWPPLFLYLNHDASLLGDFFVAKVFSPDYYLHADPGIALNFDNPFARKLGIATPAPALRTSTCLP